MKKKNRESLFTFYQISTDKLTIFLQKNSENSVFEMLSKTCW